MIDRQTCATRGASAAGLTAVPAASFPGRSAGLGSSRATPASSSSSPSDCRAISAKTGMSFACSTEVRSPPDSSSAESVSPPSTFSISASLDSAATSVSFARRPSALPPWPASTSTTPFLSSVGKLTTSQRGPQSSCSAATVPSKSAFSLSRPVMTMARGSPRTSQRFQARTVPTCTPAVASTAITAASATWVAATTCP